MENHLQKPQEWFRRQHPATQHAIVGGIAGSTIMGLMVGNFGIAAGGDAAGFNGWFTGLWVGAFIGVCIWGWFKKA